MTDRELLELAYRAAFGGAGLSRDADMRKHWDPLTDDGDALRLGHKLRLFSDVAVWPVRIEDFRRAIVRAAAEIGKELK